VFHGSETAEKKNRAGPKKGAEGDDHEKESGYQLACGTGGKGKKKTGGFGIDGRVTRQAQRQLKQGLNKKKKKMQIASCEGKKKT